MKELHPWHQFYYEKFGNPANLLDGDLERIQKFREASKNQWSVGNTLRRVSNEMVTTKNTSMDVPKCVHATYMVYDKYGSSLVLTPVFREVAANDRLDLKFICLNNFAIDTLNQGRIDINQYHIGSILCVTKMKPKKGAIRSEIDSINHETYGKKYYWEVLEFFALPNEVKENILILPHRVSTRGNYLCVSGEMSQEIFLHRKVAPWNTQMSYIFSADVFVPSTQPNKFLASLKPENWRALELKCRDMLPIDQVLPVAIKVSKPSDVVFKMFNTFRLGFGIYEEVFARNLLMAVVAFGANGLQAIADSKLDTRLYTSRIDDFSVEQDHVFFKFVLSGVNIWLKWNQNVYIKIGIGLGDDYFFAEVNSAKQISNSEYRIEGKTSAQNIALFETGEDRIFVWQFSDSKSRFISKFGIPPGSNADRIIHSIYGGDKMIYPGRVDVLDLEIPPNLLESQVRYIQMVCNAKIPAVIGSSSFGCGKSTTIANAALVLSKFEGTYMHIVATVTNSGAMVLLEKMTKINPMLCNNVVRLVTESNMAQLGSEFQTQFDYPTQVKKMVQHIIDNEHLKMESDAFKVVLQKIRDNEKTLTDIPARSTISQQLFKAGITKWEVVDLFFKYAKPKIIVGTADTILREFTNNKWKDYSSYVSTLQLDESSMVPRSTFLQLLSVFPHSRFSMVGDHRQLSPYVTSSTPEILANSALGSTLEDCLMADSLPTVHFDRVFRCHKDVTELLSEMFYDAKLVSSHTTSTGLLFNNYPLIFIDTKAKQDCYGKSFKNKVEMKMAINLAEILLQSVQPEDLAILCLYKGQAESLAEWSRENEVYVGSVDSAQGREWQVCIVCTTRTSCFTSSPFVLDKRRVNVALSRSKSSTFILGNKTSMWSAKYWSTIIQKCHEHNTLIDESMMESIIEQ